MTNGWPEEYYAVIFTTQRSDAEMELYGLTSQRMIELAQKTARLSRAGSGKRGKWARHHRFVLAG
jgi:hypothetical protein